MTSLRAWRHLLLASYAAVAAPLSACAQATIVANFGRFRSAEVAATAEAEVVEHGKACRESLTCAAAMPVPERIRARIAEDERMFTYGERTLAYYHECVQAFQLARACRRGEARTHYAEAKRLASLLREDTWSPGLAYTTNEPSPLDAFYATFATEALTHLASLLDEPGPGAAHSVRRQ